MMNDQADGSGPVTGSLNRAGTWFERLRESVKLSGRCRRRCVAAISSAAMLLAVGAITGCDSMPPARPVPAEACRSRPAGTLAPGDEIRVVFSGAPELNTQQKIQPNGKVSLPTLGEVTAAGRTVTNLQGQLTALYQPRLQDSTVTVSLMGTTAGVYVAGAVLRPGKIPLDRPLTVLEAVMEAGGFSPIANPRRVIVVRTQGGRSRNYVLDLYQALHGTESIPFYVRPYDVIYVKESAW